MRDHRTRLALVLAVQALTLFASFVLVVPQLGLYTEDRLFVGRVERETARVAEAFERSGRRPEPAPEFALAVEPSELPPHLVGVAGGLGPGVHELQRDDQGREVEVFVGVGEVGGRRFRVVHDVAALEVVQGVDDPVFTSVVGIGLAVTLAATGLSLLIARRLFRAVGDLGRLAEAASVEAPADELAARFAGTWSDDEIGRVAAALERVHRANRAALEREQRFTRDASHELRSPITVVRGALELLEGRVDDERARRALGRAASATDEMEELVQSFLWLARAPREDERFEPVDVADVAARVRERLDPASAARVRVLGGGTPARGPEPIVATVVRNLVTNALTHGGGAGVLVQVRAGALEVENDAPDEDTARPDGGFGFGLSIVEDLCGRFGWSLTFAIEGEPRRARARVVFEGAAG